MAPLIDVSDLTVHFNTYEGRHRVLNGVNLTIEEGETVALVGESGCGKSVTAKTIMGILPRPPGEIVEGEIRFRGTDLLSDDAEHERMKREEASMIFQDPMTHLSPVFTVGTMMRDIGVYRDRTDISWREVLGNFFGDGGEQVEEIDRRSVELFKQLQIPDPEGMLDRYPVELSGGLRQRVLIAMALLNQPEFLVADEPTTALDVTVQEQIIDLLSDQIEERNLSMLYITHNLGVARKLADKIYVMYGGNVVESARTRNLFDAPVHPYTRGLIETIPKLTGFESTGIDGRIPDYTTPPSGCRYHPRCPAFMEGTCEIERPKLFDLDGETNEHDVACYLYEDGMTASEANDIADREIQYGAVERTPKPAEQETNSESSTVAEASGQSSEHAAEPSAQPGEHAEDMGENQ